ncbi:MAG: GNAT family N-acetyltransferase [Anaeroplasmataceae bacterium]|nr:GNAT family N-acetyltransferase [Anaeroplasmataceae bacterium]
MSLKKENIVLKEISKEDEQAFCAFEKRYKKECGNEKVPYSLNPNNLEYNEFLKELEKCKHIETLPEGFVLARYYLIYVDDRLVGGINLRLGTNDFILNSAGHIGYGIAPWERNKGYAKEALKRVLLLGLDFGMKDFLLTTNLDNLASQKVILSCGGVLEKETIDKKLFWIHLGEYQREESAMAIVFYKNKILATKELIYGKEVISCPKGHIEGKETHIETAIRECLEETNVILTHKNYLKEGIPYQIKFMDHHNKAILKTIFPVCFQTQEEGNLISKEERILEIKYMDLAEFLEKCSYDNVKEMVKGSLKDIL